MTSRDCINMGIGFGIGLLLLRRNLPVSKVVRYSKGEQTIKKILDAKGIDYIQQARFNNCRNKLPLPFDFYIPSKNVVIEFQGIQHRFPVPFFGGISTFNRIVKCDSLKESFCRSRNIRYIAIDYDFSEIEKL